GSDVTHLLLAVSQTRPSGQGQPFPLRSTSTPHEAMIATAEITPRVIAKQTSRGLLVVIRRLRRLLMVVLSCRALQKQVPLGLQPAPSWQRSPAGQQIWFFSPHGSSHPLFGFLSPSKWRGMHDP